MQVVLLFATIKKYILLIYSVVVNNGDIFPEPTFPIYAIWEYTDVFLQQMSIS